MQRMTGRNPQAVAFGKRLKAAREGAGLTYIETSFQVRQYLSKAQRFSYSTLSRWEHGAVPEDDIDPVPQHMPQSSHSDPGHPAQYVPDYPRQCQTVSKFWPEGPP